MERRRRQCTASEARRLEPAACGKSIRSAMLCTMVASQLEIGGAPPGSWRIPVSDMPLSGMALPMVLSRMGGRDWIAERTNYPSKVAVMALAHAVATAMVPRLSRNAFAQDGRPAGQSKCGWQIFLDDDVAVEAKYPRA